MEREAALGGRGFTTTTCIREYVVIVEVYANKCYTMYRNLLTSLRQYMEMSSALGRRGSTATMCKGILGYLRVVSLYVKHRHTHQTDLSRIFY